MTDTSKRAGHASRETAVTREAARAPGTGLSRRLRDVDVGHFDTGALGEHVALLGLTAALVAASVLGVLGIVAVLPESTAAGLFSVVALFVAAAAAPSLARWTLVRLLASRAKAEGQ